MSNIDKAIAHKLLNSAGISSIVGDRVYPVRLPQTVTFPLLVFQSISGKAIKYQSEPTALPRPRYQITCWSNLFEDVVALDLAVLQAIDGKRENWGTGTYVTFIQSCIAESEPLDNPEPETGLFVRSRDYFIQYSR